MDINIVRRYFDEEAWAAVTRVYEQCKGARWNCAMCSLLLESDGSICCDGCLQRIHLKCNSLTKPPRSRFWFYKDCK